MNSGPTQGVPAVPGTTAQTTLGAEELSRSPVAMSWGLPGWIRWFLPLVGLALCGLVVWKQGRRYESFPIPDKAFVRQAPVFQLHDQSMKLLRLQRYIGRHKLMMTFIDTSQ